MTDGRPSSVPAPHRAFIQGSIGALSRDARIAGTAAGGPYLINSMDAYSDPDLMIAVESRACGASDCLRVCVELHRSVRVPAGEVEIREEAERAAMAYVPDIEQSCPRD